MFQFHLPLITLLSRFVFLCFRTYWQCFQKAVIACSLQNVTLDLKLHGDIYSNSQKYIVWVKIIDFFFYAKNH